MTTSWEVPDVFFSAAQQRAAEKVVHALGPDRLGLAFLAGSLAVGLGHATSDVDLYLVGEHTTWRQAVYEHDGVAVHAVSLPADLIDELIGLGSAYRATSEDREQLSLDLRRMHGLVRVLTGRRLLCAPHWTEALKRLRRDVVRQILISRNACDFADLAEDVAGALASNDAGTAGRASGLALEAAAEAALAAAGDIYIGQKFLFRRLRRNAATRAWAPPLWWLLNQTLPGWPPVPPVTGRVAQDELDDDLDAVRQVAERRLHTGSLLLSWSALEGWDRPLEMLPDPQDAQRGFPDRDGSTPWGPCLVPVQFADGLALIDPGQTITKTSPDEVRALWSDRT
jgi:hypothetical protein